LAIAHLRGVFKKDRFERDLANNNNTNNQSIPIIAPQHHHASPLSPIISWRIFGSPSPQRTGSHETDSDNQPRCSTRSNFGQTAELFDPSNNLATNYVESSSTSPSEHCCNALGLKLPSTTRGRTTSQGECTKTSY
jgi:hypothetical protein